MQEFFHMGGYAFYVWMSFGLGAAGIIYILLAANLYTKKKRDEVSQWLMKQ
jgi:heme exporter protein CcmD